MSSANSWTGAAGDSNWDDPANWSAGVVPSSGSADVAVTKDGTYDVLIQAADPTYTLRSLTLGSATSSPTLIDHSSLTVNTSTILDGSSDLVVDANGTANFNTLTLSSTSVITDHGAINVDSAVSGNGTINIDGGELFANSAAGNNTYLLSNGGIVTLTTDSTSSGTVNFADSSANTLNLVVSGSVYAGPITGFGGTGHNVIDLGSLAYNSHYTDTYSGSTLVINDGNTTKFVLTDINNAGPVFLKSDGTGGTELVSCFMAGTKILTMSGEVSVEELSAGDMMITNEGKSQPIRWLGRQTVSMRFADPLRVAPIRIKAGALAEGIPSRDLLISPDHAVLLDGILIQAGALVNGNSIIRELAVPETFVYYHVELADHSLIIANGVAAETFIDSVDRLSFDNWAEHDALYAESAPIVEMSLPRAKSYRQVPQQLCQRLQLRAAEYSLEITAA